MNAAWELQNATKFAKTQLEAMNVIVMMVIN